MTLCYGTAEDPQSPYIEVFTDFTVGHDDTVSLRYALGQAVSREADRQRGNPEHTDPVRGPKGPFEHGRLDIRVAGASRVVRTLTYRDFHALRFDQDGLRVTAISRTGWPDHPEFAEVTSLEPQLTAMAAFDPEVVKARLRAQFPDGPPKPSGSQGLLAKPTPLGHLPGPPS
jgi:hypothetical protein